MAGERIGERVRKSLDERGTLEVMRRGVEMLGLKESLLLVQFKPALTINPAIQQRYASNRLRVVRQVRHSPNHPNDALDLVLFVNGIAVATAELKSDFTQSVNDAVVQYRVIETNRVAGVAGQHSDPGRLTQRVVVEPELDLVHAGLAARGAAARDVGDGRFKSLSCRLRPKVSCAASRSMSAAMPNTVSTRSMVARLVDGSPASSLPKVGTLIPTRSATMGWAILRRTRAARRRLPWATTWRRACGWVGGVRFDMKIKLHFSQVK